jgi:transposase
MILVGCDLHTRKQQVALLNTDTGELWDQELSHDGDAVERFYATLPPPVTVGIESTGYSLWFHALLQRLGHRLLVGEAAKIRAMVVRKTKTDRRDARHLRDLLKDDRLPLVWIPDPATRDLRALIKHRLRLVRIRTMVKNGLHAIALNQRLALGSSLWSRQGLAHLQALVLPPHTRRRRDDSLELLHWLNAHIDELDLHVATAAAANPDACRLMTHPGVGPLTALATVLVLGPVARFPGSKHVVSYYRVGTGRERLRRQVPAGAHQQAGQRAPALGARPGGSPRDPRRYPPQAHLCRGPPATWSAQGQGRTRPAAADPALRHAARPDRLRRILPPGPCPTSWPRAARIPV